ncbi:hypothetical protein LAZ67_1002109, partial [Cordylochernes scorpioides]
MATNFIRAESPSKAEQKPVRHGSLAQPRAELSANQDLQNEIPIVLSKNQNYVNPPAGGQEANYAAPVDLSLSLAAIPTSNAAAQVRRNWADITEEVNPGAEEGFTLVQGRKRRRGSGNSPTTAAPYSNAGASRTIRRPQSSAGSVPRAQEIRATRAHIADARARQSSSSEEHCVYIEHSPELEPFHYLRALDRKLGGTAGVIQITKVNGHQLLGLTNRGLAERLISEGLEVEGTLLRAFPFRKRAERITVGNLPFFVADSAVITALSPYGRVTSIAPKQMKAGPYVYVDGRRDVFITLHEGITIERLPTRLDINIKGQAWPAYLSSGIRCSRCHGQGHRRAICPLLAGLANNTRMAPPTTPAGVPPPTTSAPPQRSAAQPPAPAPSNLAMEVCSAPPMARAVLHPSAPRPFPPAAPALPMEETPSAPPPVIPAPSLQVPKNPVDPRSATPRHPEPTPPARPDFAAPRGPPPIQETLGPAAPTKDVEMSIVEETIASSTSSAKNATRVDLDAFIEGLPSVSFAKKDALGLGREEVLDLLSSRTKAQRKGPLLSPPQCDALVGLIGQILDLKPGHTSNLYKVLGQVKAELRTTPAVPPTPTLPAPWPSKPTPPALHGEKTSPDIATPPPPLSTEFIDACYDQANDIIYELSDERYSETLSDIGVTEGDIVEAIIFPDDREPLLRRLSTQKRTILAGIVSAASERARSSDPFVREGLRILSEMLPPPPNLIIRKSRFAERNSNSFEKKSKLCKSARRRPGCKFCRAGRPLSLAAIPTSNAAAQVRRNWADITEEVNPGAEEGFTLVQGRKRRRGSGNSPTTAAPSSNAGASRTIRRPQSSAGSVPRAQEIRATRAHIADARARQSSSSEEHCVYIEHSPELEPFHYLRALDRKLGGTAGVIQITKVNGHQLLGLTNRGLAERLISEGLEVEGTLLRAFPFRKRAERITVGNLPFFVADSAVITALSPYGRVTSIAPKQMKAGPYVYVDGRRDVFITLHEGITIERLPTRLDINIKGQAWPAYLSSGIRCSRCHGQGHRRAICPLLAGLANNTRMAPPTTPAGVPPPTTSAPPQRSAAQPPAPAPSNLAMEVCSAPPMARAVLHPSALRPSPPAAPALPMEETPPAPPPVTPAPPLQVPKNPVDPRSATPRHPEPTPPARPDFAAPRGPPPIQETLGPAAPTQDVEMSIVAETTASSASSTRNATGDDLVAFIEGNPSVSFARTDALSLGREEVLDLLSSRTKAQRIGPLLSPPQCDALVGLIGQILDLKPGHTSNLYKVLGQVRAELTKTPAAAPTPPLPAPRPTGPTPPVPHEEQMTDEQEDVMIFKIFRKLKHMTCLRPLYDTGIDVNDLKDAILFTEDRASLMTKLSPALKGVLAEFLGAAIELARGYHHDVGTDMAMTACTVSTPHVYTCSTRPRWVVTACTVSTPHVYTCSTRPRWVVTACTVSTPHVYTCSTRPRWVVTACTVSTPHVYTCSTRPWWVVTACTVSTPHVYTCSTRPWWVVTACTVSIPHAYTCSTRPRWVVTACTVSTPHVYTCSTRPRWVVTACTVSTPHVYTCSTRPWWVVTACTVSTPHVYTCSTRPWWVVTACTVSTPHVYTRPCGHASRELPSFSPLASGITSRMATNLAWAESPSNAEQKPVRHGAKAQPCAELSKKEDFQKKTSNLFNKNQNYANPPAGGHHANPATPTDFVTASFSEAAAQANRSWADLAEDNNQESEDPFITVQRKKRRRGSAESPAAAAPSSNIRGAGAIRRPRSSTGWAPRAEEIRTTRAHIVEARARQASSTEDHCVYVERSPELEPFHYMRAIERMFGGTREVFQLTKMNGHFLVGLANRGMAERLVNEGLEVEGTLHRAFPFRKRAERITVGNLPFFVGDAAVISALSSFGRVTSIAPKLMKAGPYIYNDGRREAFIILREGMTIERLPTRLDITIKGEAWPAYLSSGIRCSRCRGQGHRRANCPLLARRTTAPGPATPTSPTSVPPATAPRLPQQPSAQPPPPASPSPTMEVSDVPPTSRAALHPPAALRKSSPAPSALPAEDAPLAPPPMTPAPSLRTPGSREPAAPTPDVEMSIVEETSASFTSTAKNATRIDLDAFIERHPSVSFAETDALGLGREEVLDLLSSRTKTQRSVPLLPLSQCNALAGLIRQILDLRPGAASNLYKVLGQVKAELRTTPAAVPPTPPLPAPRPAEPMLPTTHREELTPPLMTPPPPAPTDMEEDDPMTEKERDTPPPPAPRLAETTPPIPHGEKTSPHIATPPPPLSCQFIDDRWTEADDILYELNQERDWGVGISESDITEAVIYPEDREPLIRRLSTRRRSLLAAFISAAIERARDADPFVREGIFEKKSKLCKSARRRPGCKFCRAGRPLAAIPTSNAAAQVRRNWADITEQVNPGAEEGFTLVQGRKRRRGSGNSPTTAAPSSNAGASRTIRRPQSSAGSVPRAQEIRATRAHIADARARQASSSEEHCVYIEHSPELEPFHYLRALDRKLGGTAGVIQITKSGKDYSFPFFVADSAVITALSPFGRVTSIAPKQMKAGPYVYVDGRRDVFITLHEGITIERLPTRLDINIKGQAWPAYLSSGIRCSRCHGQGHRRAICPLLAGLANNTRMAPPTTPAGVPPPTTSASPQRSAAQPPAPAPSNLAMEVCSAPPMARAVLHPSAPRPSPPAAPALPMEETPSAPPPVIPAPALQVPKNPVDPRSATPCHPEPTPPARPDFAAPRGPPPIQETLGPAAPTQDVEMSIVEETTASSASSTRNATGDDLVAFIEGNPSVSFARTDALGLGREEVLDLLSSRTKAQRNGPLLSPPQCDALVGLIGQILDLKPGHTSNLYKVLGQVRAELTKTPAAAPTPPLPAPRPTGPTPPVPHEEQMTEEQEDVMIFKIFRKLKHMTCLRPLYDTGID